MNTTSMEYTKTFVKQYNQIFHYLKDLKMTFS